MAYLRVGLIGAGRIAGVHMEAYRLTDKATVVAVADVDADRAKALGQSVGARAYGNYRELLADDTIDAVDICTPVFTHEQVAIDALNAGKHVSLQKPMSLDLDSCDRIIKAAKENRKILVVPYMYRHAPLTVKGKEILESGQIGKPTMAYHHMLCPPTVTIPLWFHEEEKSGGVIVDTLTHGIDLFNWYFGSPNRLSAEIGSSVEGSSARGKHDSAAVVARYANEVIGSFRVTWNAPIQLPTVVTEVIGTKGAIRLETPTSAISYFRLTLYRDGGMEVFESPGRGHNEKTHYFIRVALGLEPLGVSAPEMAREAMRVALTAREAARQGKVLEL
jgi:predicted dehydrogenase